MNPLLSIFIPTYNRAQSLDYILRKTIKSIYQFNIPIYISNNNSDDDTEYVILKYEKEYPYLNYIKQEENIGLDRNMLEVLRFVDSKYILMLGDDDYIAENFYSELYEYLNDNFDFIVLSMNLNNKTKIFQDSNLAFNFLWDKMPYGTLIIKTKIVSAKDIHKYIGTSHAYSAIPWEIISKKEEYKVLYYSEKNLITLGKIKKTWKDYAINIYFYQIPLWFSLLPEFYETDEAYKIYMKRAFNLKNLLNLRYFIHKFNLTSYEFLNSYQKLLLKIIFFKK